MTPWEIQEAWTRFKCGANMRSRDKLIEQYAYLVKITAGRVISNMPPSLERDDLVSAGIVGFIKAVDQFDIARKVKFETYAIALIRGAILEMLREDDWVPRSTRERSKLLARTYAKLELNLRRPATEDEMAEELKVTQEEFQKMLVEVGRTSLLSMEDVLVGSDSGEKLHLADVIQDDGLTPTVEAELCARRRLLGKAVDRLPDRERKVISLYYYEGMTFKEIGKILTISESRVYQLHTQAVLRMHGYLLRDSDLFVMN